MSWLKEEWDRVVVTVAASSFAGLCIGIAKTLILQRHGGWLPWLSMMAAAVVVAVMIGLTVDSTALPPTQKWAIVGLCAYLAEDILIGVGALVKLASTDPFGTVHKILDLFRGRRPPPPPGDQ